VGKTCTLLIPNVPPVEPVTHARGEACAAIAPRDSVSSRFHTAERSYDVLRR
jgi:hypothetical protein